MNIFDIIGPIMIGPSSSHTAGAVRIGKVARELLGEKPKSVQVTLHGSFAKTGRGHGTNSALLAGVLGFSIYDERMKDSQNIAKEHNLEFSFEELDLGLVHPNTAKVYLEGISGNKITVLASSLGGGRIEVNSIDDAKVSFSAELNTLVVFHSDKPGIVSAISGELAKENINIAYMKLYREGKGEQAVTVIESDQSISENCIKVITSIENIYRAVFIAPINKG
jgi:L-serine dehydratase